MRLGQHHVADPRPYVADLVVGYKLQMPGQRRQVRPGTVLRQQRSDGRDEIGERDGGPAAKPGPGPRERHSGKAD